MENFSEIVEKYTQRIYFVVRRIVGDHHDADDVVQNTFIKAWQNFESFRGESGVYTWLYRIAVNESLAHLRRGKSRFSQGSEGSAEELLKLHADDQYFDADHALALLHTAIESLPPKQRAVFNMRYFDEIPYAQMAEILGTSQGALKASYHHAQKKIEEFLNLSAPQGI